LEPEVIKTILDAALKAGLQLLVQSPARAVVVAEAGMEQKEQAEMVVPAVAAGAWMLLKLAGMAIRHPLHRRKVTMAELMREAWAIKVVLAAVEQERLAQLALLVARQEMAGMDAPAVSAALRPTMLEGAEAREQPPGVQAMAASAAEVLVVHQGLQTLVVGVVVREEAEVGVVVRAVPAS
jgi:hypothetical protein